VKRTGKLPFVVDERDLVFANYRTGEVKLPKHPASFGHDDLVRVWGMLGNGDYGCCGPASAVHFFMEASAESGRPCVATTDSCLDLYGFTGFKRGDPSTDQGTVLRDMFKDLIKHGYVDGAGTVHEVKAFVRVDHTDLEQLQEAAYLFSGVIMGYNLPKSAEEQFDAGKPWSVVKGSPSVGGHAVFVPRFEQVVRAGVFGAIADAVAGRRLQARCVTWGEEEIVEEGFIRANADEAWAIVTPDTLKDGKTLEGLDMDSLLADLKAVAA
jgi:hypothetical protein